MITVSRIHKHYAGESVLENINLTADKGETLCLLGPSGCGKTTLLKMISGQEDIEEGDITCASDNIGYLFQDRELLPWRTVSENIALGLEFQKRPEQEIKSIVADYLGQFGLSDAANKIPAEISGGMKRRAALAQTLVTGTELLLLDEPLTGLDINGRRMVSAVIKRYIKRYNATAVIVTHSIEEALFLADRVLIFSQKPAKVTADIPVSETNRKEAFGKIFDLFIKANPQEDCYEHAA